MDQLLKSSMKPNAGHLIKDVMVLGTSAPSKHPGTNAAVPLYRTHLRTQTLHGIHFGILQFQGCSMP
jgi:hypothetical protein